MFGLSKKEILANAIINASKNNINIYKQAIKDNYKEVLDCNDEEKMNEFIIKTRKLYLDKVYNDVITGMNIASPTVVSKIKFLSMNMDAENGMMAGKLFSVCYRALTGKEADSNECIRLNHVQNDMMTEVMKELDDEISKSEEDDTFSIQDMALGIHKLIATELVRVETILKEKHVEYDRNEFITSTFAYYYGTWMAFVKRKITEEQFSRLEKMMNELYVAFNEITYRDNPEMMTYSKVRFEKKLKSAIETISKGIMPNGAFADCQITDTYLKEFMNEKVDEERKGFKK